MAKSDAIPDHPLLKNLNSAQRRAVTSSTDTVAILAGPGSGKTHTLTTRVAWLIQNAGYHPSTLVVATFTVKASREMKERIAKVLGEDVARSIVLGTFHSIAVRYLRAYGSRIGLNNKFAIADDSDSRAIITRIIKRFDALSCDPASLKNWISKKKVRVEADGPEETAGDSQGKKKLWTGPDYQRVYDAYQDHLERSNLLDYDDLLVKSAELLRRFPSCVKNVQAVLIDEYQDTNGIQYELIKLLASARGRITVVGDPDQSIYGWRSAEIRNLRRLLNEFPGTAEVSLEENYRSSQTILDASLKVIQQDKSRYEKILRPTHTRGTPPVMRTLFDAGQEGEWIVGEIRRTMAMSGGMLNQDDFAILLRSAYLSRHVEAALGKEGVSYRMVGGLKFYERVEIKILLDYLRVIFQPDNNDPLVRIINTPKRGIGPTTIKNLLEEAETAKKSLWGMLLGHVRGQHKLQTKLTKSQEQRLTAGLVRLVCGLQHRLSRATADNPGLGLVEMIEEVMEQLDLKNHIMEAHPDDHEGRIANLDEFVTLARDFVRELNVDDERLPEVEGEEQAADTAVLGKFLSNVALATDAQTGNGEEGEKKPLVTISTIHAAKGLEWPVVFVPAVYNGSLPHTRAEDQDEERRLLYVAMTRAQALLYLSVPWFSGRGDEVERTDFVPDTILKSFSTQGPSFDHGTVEAMAKILRRKAPSMTEIYAGLPEMFSIQDDRHPEFPLGFKKPKGARGAEQAPGEGSHQWGGPPQKRRRVWSGEDPTAHEEDQMPWQKEYATTMEQASNFTVPAALPGFTTAGAHRAAQMAAEAKAAAAAAARGPSSRGGKAAGRGGMAQQAGRGGTAKRPAKQTTLSHFQAHPASAATSTAAGIKRTAAPEGPYVPERKVRPGQVGMCFNQALPQSVIQEMTKRGLQDVKRRVHARRQDDQKPSWLQPGAADGSRTPPPQEQKVAKTSKYPGFSSSPPRPPTPEPKKPAVKAGDDDEVQFVGSVRVISRPPASFHATTMGGGRNGVGGAGVVRPQGLGREGMAPMQRLAKPFKPLTVNRNGNLARQ